MKLHWKVNIAYFTLVIPLFILYKRKWKLKLYYTIYLSQAFTYTSVFFLPIQLFRTFNTALPDWRFFQRNPASKKLIHFFLFSSIKIRFATILPLTSTFADTCEILLIFSKCYIQFCNHLMIDLTHLMLLVTHGKIHGYFLLNSLLFRAFSFVECVLRLSDSLNFIWCAGARRSRS